MFWVILITIYLLFGLILALADIRDPHSTIVQTLRRNGPGLGWAYTLFIFLLTLVIAPLLWLWSYLRGKISTWRRE